MARKRTHQPLVGCGESWWWRGRTGCRSHGLTNGKTQGVRPASHPLGPPRLVHTVNREPHASGLAWRDTHQHTSPATTADQVTQQDLRCLVCTAPSCLQQHTQTRWAVRRMRFRPRQAAATSPRNSSDCRGREDQGQHCSHQGGGGGVGKRSVLRPGAPMGQWV